MEGGRSGRRQNDVDLASEAHRRLGMLGIDVSVSVSVGDPSANSAAHAAEAESMRST